MSKGLKIDYFCEKCGRHFDTEAEGMEHVAKCGKKRSMEDRVKELEERLDMLEKYVELMRHVPATTPGVPYISTPEPLFPKSPYWNEFFWASNRAEKGGDR